MEWFLDLKCRTTRRNLASLDGKEAKFTPDREGSRDDAKLNGRGSELSLWNFQNFDP